MGYTAKNKQIEKFEKRKAVAANSVREAERLLKNLNKSIKLKSAQEEDLRKRIADNQVLLAGQQDQIEEYNDVKTRLNIEEFRLSDVTAALDLAVESKKNVDKELAGKKVKLHNTTEKIKTNEAQLKRLKNSVEETNGDLEIVESLISRKNAELDQKNDELETLTQEYNDLEIELGTLKDYSAFTSKEATDLEKRLAKLKEEDLPAAENKVEEAKSKAKQIIEDANTHAEETREALAEERQVLDQRTGEISKREDIYDKKLRRLKNIKIQLEEIKNQPINIEL